MSFVKQIHIEKWAIQKVRFDIYIEKVDLKK
jgi:hypothetical protein